VHLHKELQTSRDEVRERFSTSSWVARQDQQEPTANSRSGEPQQQQKYQEGADAANALWQTEATIPWEVQQQQDKEEGTENANTSWQTQATVPWCPPWS